MTINRIGYQFTGRFHSTLKKNYDVIIVGGGHNGLVAVIFCKIPHVP